MAAPTLVFIDLDLNDGTVYTLMPGARLGAKLKSWNDYRSYSGSVARYHVSEAYYIETHWPIAVQGSSLADLTFRVDAINARIDSCTYAAPGDLVFAGTTYSIVDSENVDFIIGQREALDFRTLLDLVLYRTP